MSLSAKSGLMHCNKNARYSITSSASESTLSEIFTPSAFVVRRLITIFEFGRLQNRQITGTTENIFAVAIANREGSFSPHAARLTLSLDAR